MGRNGSAGPVRVELVIFVLETMVPMGIGHDVPDLLVGGVVPLLQPSVYLIIHVAAVSGLVVEDIGNLPALIDLVQILVLAVFKMIHVNLLPADRTVYFVLILDAGRL